MWFREAMVWLACRGLMASKAAAVLAWVCLTAIHLTQWPAPQSRVTAMHSFNRPNSYSSAGASSDTHTVLSFDCQNLQRGQGNHRVISLSGSFLRDEHEDGVNQKGTETDKQIWFCREKKVSYWEWFPGFLFIENQHFKRSMTENDFPACLQLINQHHLWIKKQSAVSK